MVEAFSTSLIDSLFLKEGITKMADPATTPMPVPASKEDFDQLVGALSQILDGSSADLAAKMQEILDKGDFENLAKKQEVLDALAQVTAAVTASTNANAEGVKKAEAALEALKKFFEGALASQQKVEEIHFALDSTKDGTFAKQIIAALEAFAKGVDGVVGEQKKVSDAVLVIQEWVEEQKRCAAAAPPPSETSLWGRITSPTASLVYLATMMVFMIGFVISVKMPSSASVVEKPQPAATATRQPENSTFDSEYELIMKRGKK
jgi:hypothetical protein